MAKKKEQWAVKEKEGKWVDVELNSSVAHLGTFNTRKGFSDSVVI